VVEVCVGRDLKKSVRQFSVLPEKKISSFMINVMAFYAIISRLTAVAMTLIAWNSTVTFKRWHADKTGQ
jgi:hypothetical protein